MTIVKSAVILALLLAAGMTFTGCENKGPVEEAGEKVDDFVKDMGKKIDDYGK